MSQTSSQVFESEHGPSQPRDTASSSIASVATDSSDAGVVWWRRHRAKRRKRTRSLLHGLAGLLALGVFVGMADVLPPSSAALLAVLVLYAVYNEAFRLGPYRAQILGLTSRVRKLVEGRRQAGLMRLEQEVKQRNQVKQGWSYPPLSGAAAVMRRHKGNGRSFELGPQQEVDYRNLCLTTLAKLEKFALETRELSGEKATQSSVHEPHELSWWLLQQLSQVGPQPGRDAELYRTLHSCMDHVDDQHSAGSQWHCRLCLAAQTRWVQKRRIRLQCGHALCEACAKQLVADALAGHIAIPVACPVGCAGGGANNTIGTLHPSAVRDLLPEEDYERLSRLHQVRAKLGQSAPHSGSLAADLADARSKAGVPHSSGSQTNASSMVSTFAGWL